MWSYPGTDRDARQMILLSVAAAGSLLFAFRAVRMRDNSTDVWSVVWSVVMVIVGAALWMLGHDPP